MATIVRMPSIAAGDADAAIQSWLVAVGDNVGMGQELVEIETEKAVVEYEAEAAGVLAAILVNAGETAGVGQPIAVLAEEGQSAADAIAEAGISAASAPAPATPEVAPAAPVADAVPAAPATPVVSGDAAPAPAAAPADTSTSTGERLFASPLVRKIAREKGFDLTGVTGSGPNGRIVRRDIEGLTASAPEPAAAAAPAPAAPAAAPAAAPGAGYVDEPHTGMRRAIARRLTESKSQVPHFYLAADCRVDALLALRAQINEQSDVRVSVNDLVVKAVARALRDVPGANAIWTDEATRRFDGVDISVAVSVPGGLLTPVVRGVEKLSVSELSLQIKDYAERARAGKLKQHELEGGSFSVSNLGMYGTTEFSAILNPPQSGILAVGAAVKQPVVNGEGEIEVASVMRVTLSADHRVLDGALAAEWLRAFKERIESPLTLLI